MAYRKVLQWPDRSLGLKSEDVSLEEEGLSSLFEDMIDTLKIEKGAGLAAPQIGVHKNVVLLDLGSWDSPTSFTERVSDELVDERYWFLLNPTLTNSRETQKWEEGCLSVPWTTGEVERSTVCEISYYTKDLKPATMLLPWPISGAMQHECDHLLGKLYIDRMSRLKSRRIKQSILKKRKKIEDYKENLLKDHDEKVIGKKKRNANLSKKEIKKRKASKRLSRSRRA